MLLTVRTAPRRGFTLLELLVVIAVTAMVAAILLPVFPTGLESARRASCQFNEKQLGIAFVEYSQENDEKMPQGNADNRGGQGWASQIYPYVKSIGLYRCPDDSAQAATIKPQAYPVSYGYNLNLTPGISQNGTIYNSLFSLSSPAQTVLLFETDDTPANPAAPLDQNSVSGWGTDSGGGSGSLQPAIIRYATGCMGLAPSPCNPANNATQTGRHQDGSNFLLSDGHVKWLRPRTISSGTTAMSESSAPGINGNFSSAAGTGYVGSPSYAATFSPL